jgi:hypothetical protein
LEEKMSDNVTKLLDAMERLLPRTSIPFQTPLGPTDKCLSSTQIVSFIEGGEVSQDVVNHLDGCEICQEILIRSKRLLSMLPASEGRVTIGGDGDIYSAAALFNRDKP